MTTVRPTKNGIEPITSKVATISPHSAIGTGFAAITRSDVYTATAAPTSRSSSNGNEIALIESTNAANKKPMPVPTMISVHPGAGVSIAPEPRSLPEKKPPPEKKGQPEKRQPTRR